MLEHGKLDIALVDEKPLNYLQEFNFHWLYREPLMLALPSSHSASLKEKISLKYITDLPLYWFSCSTHSSFCHKCEIYFRQLPFNLEKISKPDDSLIMLSNIAKGKGMALLPKSMCIATRKGLCYRSLEEIDNEYLNIDIYLVTRKDEIRSNVLNIYKDLLIISEKN
ncbi:LysR substrate-binding domain-containing protein [Xenorhabdus nematophila]|nr:LysR substrate-binding domain-containing protein [Xenorhabdus nematophila]